jgi:hypothetical protein
MLQHRQLWGQVYCLVATLLALLLLLLALLQQPQLLVLGVQALMQVMTVMLHHALLLRLQQHGLLQLSGVEAASWHRCWWLAAHGRKSRPAMLLHLLLHCQPVTLKLVLLLLLRLWLAVLVLLLLAPLQSQQMSVRYALLTHLPAQSCLGQQMQSAHVFSLLVRIAVLLLALPLGAACQLVCCLQLAQPQHLLGCWVLLPLQQLQGTAAVAVTAASAAAAEQGRQQRERVPQCCLWWGC